MVQTVQRPQGTGLSSPFPAKGNSDDDDDDSRLLESKYHVPTILYCVHSQKKIVYRGNGEIQLGLDESADPTSSLPLLVPLLGLGLAAPPLGKLPCLPALHAEYLPLCSHSSLGFSLSEHLACHWNCQLKGLSPSIKLGATRHWLFLFP